MSNVENVGTFDLSGEKLTIVASMGVRNISVLLVSGTVTVKGTMKLGTRSSDALTLTDGEPINVGFDYPLDGYEIDATSGEALVITGK